eukprot:jgi/Mesen1/4302/ME000022S03589
MAACILSTYSPYIQRISAPKAQLNLNRSLLNVHKCSVGSLSEVLAYNNSLRHTQNKSYESYKHGKSEFGQTICCASASDEKEPINPRRKSPMKRRRAFQIGPVLVLFSVAAATVFRRLKQRTVGAHRDRTSMAMDGPDTRAPPPARLIDTHLHVWASPEEAEEYPYFPGQEPTMRGDVDFLVENMRSAGVEGALIVQPINHKFDHSYVASAIQRYPGKFVGCCLADPTEGGGGVQELERLLTQMTNGVGKAMFQRAGELGAPVGFMCFKGLMLHIDEIEELCAEFPGTKVLMDHFGFCKPPSNEEEEAALERLLGLSRYPQVYVKASAFFRVSREAFPYRDTWPLVRQLVAAYGPGRIMWGSDFPFVVDECGYANAWQVLPQTDLEGEVLTDEEARMVMGGAARLLFPGAWKDRAHAC